MELAHGGYHFGDVGREVGRFGGLEGKDRLEGADQIGEELPSWRVQPVETLPDGCLYRLRIANKLLFVEVMLRWGTLYAELETSGQTISTMNSLISATALHHQAIIVTHNEDHFLPAGVEIINPWKL